MADQDAPIRADGDNHDYDRDYAAWLLHQVDLVKGGRWSEIDSEHLADEIASLERWSFDELVAAVKLVVRQMLTWDVREDERNQAWRDEIDAYRGEVLQELSQSPSYLARQHEALEQAYDRARFEMSQEDKLPYRLFPEVCPYGWNDVLARKHWLTAESEPKFDCYTSQ